MQNPHVALIEPLFQLLPQDTRCGTFLCVLAGALLVLHLSALRLKGCIWSTRHVAVLQGLRNQSGNQAAAQFLKRQLLPECEHVAGASVSPQQVPPVDLSSSGLIAPPQRRPPPWPGAGLQPPGFFPLRPFGFQPGAGKGIGKIFPGAIKGKGKGKIKGKGKGPERQAPEYDPATPCGYFMAGYCHYGARCRNMHNVSYALAIRQEWLHPGEDGPRKALEKVAVETLGPEAVAAANLFPRVFSTRLLLHANESEMPKVDLPDDESEQVEHVELSAMELPHEEPDAKQNSSTIGSFTTSLSVGGESVAAANLSLEASIGSNPRYLLILDLEGKDEITEFPVIALDSSEHREVGRFQRYVRPVKLFQGCKIEEESPAITFDKVLEDFDHWLNNTLGCGLHSFGSSTAFVTCGDWDCKHVHAQCRINAIPVPTAFTSWVNIKRTYEVAYARPISGMRSMLKMLHLLDPAGKVIHGFHHLGMHDVENIGRCILHLLKEGKAVSINGWYKRRAV
eukprot:gnl/TRDRNA2_/TRDRNA2_27888_c0_seq1.p1 gnl/TRDRNA2_/TRDRNA2_27888_c0~~gnl/TRDRNA2_/TRDRNA2_27888_c0_seq1.p1  ORF type:complete len:509 (-),score=67.24 gnl/TRDRNA2_/TRDRNA2_27888_c0_seq1:15-1541(-)